MINKIHNVDCLTGLKTLPDESIDCCVTSPPYFGLRDYGHENQIGLEETPEKYVEKMVEVFTEVKRVLKKEGTLWLNLGDSYCGYKGDNYGKTKGNLTANTPVATNERVDVGTPQTSGLKPKDLIGIPWEVAFALRGHGWYLRQDIIWHKPNPMPESVTDRCTKAHEYIFLLSKSAKYYYDNEAIKLKSVYPGDLGVLRSKVGFGNPYGEQAKKRIELGIDSRTAGDDYANKRSVWTVTTKPFSEAHFATFPEDLIVDA